MKLFISFFLILNYLPFSLAQDNGNAIDYQYNSEETIPEIFFEPLEYSRSSIGKFLEYTFNHPLYGPKFFAFNLFHVLEFIKHADKTKQPRRYISKALQRFIRKEQSLLFINSTAFFEILEQLPDFLKNYFDKAKERTEILSDIKLHTYNFLMHDFKLLKNDPEAAINKFANAIYDITIEKDRNKSTDISIYRLQQIVGEFLKTTCSKLIWSARDKEWSWTLVKAIASKFLQLKQTSIISNKQLDELLWIIIYRFNYFLELEGQKLSPEYFSLVHKDLMNEHSILWEMPERNHYHLKKITSLKRSLMEAEIYAQAYRNGLAQAT